MLFVEQLSAPKTTTTTNGEPRALINDLILTQDEINGFIGHSDYLRGNMMVSFHDNLIEEEYSLPMDVLGYDGRYLVGNDYVKLGTEELNNNKNTIEMKMTTAATHEDFIDEHQNLLDTLYHPTDHYHADHDDEAIRNVIANTKSVSIEEGKIVVKARND